MDDEQAWLKYPQHHDFFNKLWLAEQCGYNCGPAGVSVEKEGWYVVRPIYNIIGMGVGATKEYLKPNDYSIPPGYFWCEWFEGVQYSITFEYDTQWKATKGYRAFRGSTNELYRFDYWTKIHNPQDIELHIPSFVDRLTDVGTINIEFINNKIIEIHLRDTPDPDYQELIPVWEDMIRNPELLQMLSTTYRYIDSPDSADGHLPETRYGFFVR